MLAACAAPAPPRVYKIALVAPFEGHHREVGYTVFPRFRALLQEHIRAHPGRAWQITFVAFNDNGDAAFAEQVARNVVYDPDVLAVIGHCLPETSARARPVYDAAALGVLDACGATPVMSIEAATAHAARAIDVAAAAGLPSRVRVRDLLGR